jgi:tetratricopeptide (TPR) repeat protein
MTGSKDKRFRTICWALTLVTVLLYWPVMRHKFIDFDDGRYITENPTVQSGLTLHGLAWAFHNTEQAAFWHPATWISHMLDCQLYGLNPAGHHFTSMLFHVANALLLFLLLQGMTKELWLSAIVAALFAWHPLRVESVAWAAERKDVLSAFFSLLTLIAYSRYARTGSRFAYGAALAAFALALMSKPMVVTLPCVMLLLDYWPLRRLQLPGLPRPPAPAAATEDQSAQANPTPSLLRLLLEKLPFFALVVGLSIMTYSTQQEGGAVWRLPLSARLANAAVSYTRYVGKTVWPARLAALYPYHEHWPAAVIIASLLLLGAITLWVVFKRTRAAWLLVGWFWFLGTLVPAIGVVQVGPQAMADRFVYVPGIGLLIMLVWGLRDIAGRHPLALRPLSIATVVILGTCLIATSRQLTYWKDSITLFERTIQVTHGNYIAYGCLGDAYEEVGRKEDALQCYDTALVLYGQSLPFDTPGEDHLQAGLRLSNRREWAEAAAHLATAAAANPTNAMAECHLGEALLAQGHAELAAIHLSHAVALDPANPDTHFQLGIALLNGEKVAEATNQFARAIQLVPAAPGPHAYLGIAEARLRHFDAAIRAFREALRRQPDLVYALDGLAWILATHPDPVQRSGKEAVDLAQRACTLTKHEEAGPMATLAAAYAEAGRFGEAVETAHAARDLALKTGQAALVSRADAIEKLARSNQPFHDAP